MKDDGHTACGASGQSWPASGEATCARCITQPMLDGGDVYGAVKVVLALPRTNKAVASSITSALADVTAAGLRV